MTQVIVFLSEAEDKIIQSFKLEWGLKSKHETIVKLIREFNEAWQTQ